ncbi:MAG: hypothetical protein O2898_07790 [Proteobacteria bacterium]|nr:hypothetical protein [Pseudomonadota bacterium]
MHSPGFDCAPGLRLQAHEQVTQLRFDKLAADLERIEALVERLEKRMWLALYGVLAVVATEAVRSVFDVIERTGN